MSIAAPPAGAPACPLRRRRRRPARRSPPRRPLRSKASRRRSPTCRPRRAQGHPVRFQRRLPGGAARSRAPLARAAQRSRHRQHPVRDRAQGRAGQQHQALLRALPPGSLAAGRERVGARLFGGRARCAGALSGRYARRSAGLVSVRGQVQGTPWLPADLRDEQQDHRAAARQLSGHQLPPRDRKSSRSGFTRPTRSRSITSKA